MPRLAGWTGAVTTLLGLAGLGIWLWSDWRIATFGPSYVPMAPITAALFVLLGGSQIARALGPGSRAAGRLETGAAVVGFAVSVAVTRQTLHYFPLPWDTWFAVSANHAEQAPLGRMGPLTAAAFLLTSIAVLAKRATPSGSSTFPRGQRSVCRWMCLLTATTSLLIAIVVLAGYAAGTPPNYGGNTVPVAGLTAVGFVLLNSSILLTGAAGFTVLRALSLESPDHAPIGNRTFTRRLIAVAALVGSLIMITGLVYMRTEQRAARDSIRAVLDSVANLKAAQISSWREERLSEGRFLQRTPAVAADIAAFLAQPSDAAARARVLGWLEPIKAGERYESILLFDATGTLRFIVGDRAVLPTDPPEQLRPGSSGPAATLGDLERDPESGRVHFDVRVPILPPAGAGTPAAPIATLILRLNPNFFLFPLIRQWPVPSPSAENLLVRREGDDLLLLNELRHHPNSALTVRRPLSERSLLVAAAARGYLGVSEGRDHRGVAVIGTARKIRDSSWILIVKIDEDEVFASVRREAWQSGVSLALLLLGIALATGFIWRQQHSLHLQRSLAAERKSLALAGRLSLVMRHANDVILILDEQGSIVEASERALAVYGYTAEELRALPPGGLRAASASLPEDLALLTEAGSRFETFHRRKDGTVFPVEVSGRAVEIDGRRLIFGIYRDITERLAHERQIGRLNRLYAALSQVNLAIAHAVNREGLLPRLAVTPGPANSAIVQALDRDTLLRHICRVLVEFGRFRMAWIGWLDPRTQQVRLAAEYGDDSGYLEGIRSYADNRPEAQDPTGTAIREGRADVCNDVIADPRMAPWREGALRAGYRSSIGLPLRLHGETRGALTVHATEPGFFSREEIALLQDAAMDVTFGLDALEREEQRRNAEAALRESGERMRLLGDNLPESYIYQYTRLPEGTVRFLHLSTGVERVHGVTAEAGQRDASLLFDQIALEQRAEWTRAEEVSLRDLSDFEFELKIHRPDGQWRWIQLRSRPRRISDKQVVWDGVATDVTERKRTEVELEGSRALLINLTNQVPGVVYQYRLYPDGRSCFPYSSSGMMDICAVTPEEVREDATAAFARIHPDDRASILSAIQESALTLQLFHREFRVVLPGRGVRWCLCDAKPERMEDGGALWYGIISDITDRKAADQALRDSLREKEALLKEVHHRVKNNLQVITSLLRLETGRNPDRAAQGVLKEMQGRIRSMALLHETLYRSGNLARVDLGVYLEQVAGQTFRSINERTGRLRLRLDLKTCLVSLDQAIPCGLIVNELVSNSLKHGFPDDRTGEIGLTLRQADDAPQVRLHVIDTGVGLPADFAARRERSLGIQLVEDLVRQLHGNITGKPGPGAEWIVTFPIASRA